MALPLKLVLRDAGNFLPRLHPHMTKHQYEKRLAEIQNLHAGETYFACVRECGALFEIALRQVLGKLTEYLNSQRLSVPIPLQELRDADRQTLGLLVKCMRDEEVQKQLRICLKSTLHRFRRISWRGVKDLRNEAVHDERHSSIDQEDSLQMSYWIRIFLEDSRLVGKKKDGGSTRQSGTCLNCKALLDSKWRFCPWCGTCIELVCVSCGSILEPSFKICPYCETAVGGGSGASAKAIHDYEMLFKGAYLDKVMTPEEQEMLEKKRLEFGLTPEEALIVQRRCVPQQVWDYQRLVEAASIDGVINDAERALLDRKTLELGLNPQIAQAIERHTNM